VKNISSSQSSTVDLSVIKKDNPVTKIVGIIFIGLSFVVTVMPAAMAETFSIDGMALNTNNQFPLKDGYPIMSTWPLNPNDNDQQFDRQGNLLRHRSTGKCLNAYQPSVGSTVNVYPCNSNDGDQKFAILSAGGNINLIQRMGTNLCLDMDSRSANTRMKLWNCNANFANQRFVSNASVNNPQPQPQPQPQPISGAQTFSIDGMALNTNSQFPLKDGHPIMSIWQLNQNDPDQQFTLLTSNLIRHGSTNKCLNAYQPSQGSKVNVYPCNANDPDQKFGFVSVGGNINLIKRLGTNLCLDMPSRVASTPMQLGNCNTSSNNQRFAGNNVGAAPVPIPTPPVSLYTTPSGSSLVNNNAMLPGTSIKSPSQCFSLNAQADGNLVLYNVNRPIWSSGTYGRSVKNTVFQNDGNLVINDSNNNSIWSTGGTSGKGGKRFTVQDDGDFAMYNSQNQLIVHTGTAQPCGNTPTPTPTPPPVPQPISVAQTFSIDGMALNTNSQFPLKDGHPIMSIWPLNQNDPDQQFTLLTNNLIRHGSTGKCLNANQPSQGSKVNVYPCNANDLDQKFGFISVGGNINLIKRLGTNLCLDMPIRTAGTPMQLGDCNTNSSNQRFAGNNVNATPVPTPPASTPTQPVANITDIPGHCKLGGSCASTTGTKHTGVDYYSNPQGTQVKAICSGTVVRALTANDIAAWDRVTVVEYKNCGGYPTLYGYYGHTNPTVKVTDPVSKGQVIGSVAFLPDKYGSDNSHLHFGLATQYFKDNWGYQSGTLSQNGWIDPEYFGRNYGWK
jgi:Ricin-type beta-trefoil lectin domain/Peptidase family M23